MKQFEILSDSWLIIAMLFRVDSLCVWRKNSVEIEIGLNRIT